MPSGFSQKTKKRSLRKRKINWRSNFGCPHKRHRLYLVSITPRKPFHNSAIRSQTEANVSQQNQESFQHVKQHFKPKNFIAPD